jgi:hypothetical protein
MWRSLHSIANTLQIAYHHRISYVDMWTHVEIRESAFGTFFGSAVVIRFA